ncbi:hypothetical protein [Embleya sp. NBC_00896]|uniref:hypothetical protein n=1 Tax=Embleya sp. NBC_00896 TaxID=2975961 RepID=UPI00386D66AA|nr:hypothetical protein OG928_26240 [Embleya sp. NBC_00896]
MRHGGMGRRWSRWTAAGLTAAVLLTGCSSDSDDKDDKGKKDPAASTAGSTGGNSGAPGGKGDKDPQAVWAALVTAATTQKVVEYHGVRTATGETSKEPSVKDELWSWYDAAGKAAFTEHSAQPTATAKPRRISCDAGKEWSYNNQLAKWSDTQRPCVVDMAREGMFVGDGLLPPGLSPEQAKRFADAIAAVPGWITPAAVEPAQQGGKSYLRLTVDLKAQQSQGGSAENTGYLVHAIRTANPDYTKSPYLVENLSKQSASPVRAVFWLDPTTHLPAYSELSTTVVDKGVPTGAVRLLRTEYIFGGPAPKADRTQLVPPPAPTWPEQGTKPPQA